MQNEASYLRSGVNFLLFPQSRGRVLAFVHTFVARHNTRSPEMMMRTRCVHF